MTGFFYDMIRLRIPSILLFFTLFYCFFISWNAHSQETQSYEGPLRLGKYEGAVNYTFKTVGNDTVFHGPFEMERSNLDALLKKEDASFLFKGAFENGQAEGPWTFQFGEFQSGSQSSVVDYEYRVLISGIQEEGNGVITNGKPDGVWFYQVSQIKDSEIEHILFKSEITFKEGIPQQNFKIEDIEYALVGRFLRNGLAHDEWSAFATNDINNSESWLFEDGVLRKIKIVEGDKVQDIDVFNDTSSKFRTISLDEAFIKIVKATLASKNLINISMGIPNLLGQNLKYYQKIDSLLVQLESSDFQPDFKAKVPYYPIDSLGKSQLDTILKNIKIAKASSASLLENSHLNIIKRTNEDALFYYNTVVNISKQFLDPMEELMEYGEDGILEYLNMPSLIKELWPNGKPKTSLEVNVGSNKRAFELPNAIDYNFEGDNLAALLQISNYARKGLESISKKLSSQLYDQEQLQVLNGVEEDLIDKNQLLLKSIDSVLDEIPGDYKKTLQRIKDIESSHLNEYASIKNSEEKLLLGNKFKTCFSNYNELAETIISQPDKIKEIKEMYLDTIWNPFMANVMEEEVKKRVIDAYSEIVVPYFLNETSTGLNCDNVVDMNNQINQMNKRMVELREQNTKKLERKLRKEKNPIEIINLLQQKSTAKVGRNEH